MSRGGVSRLEKPILKISLSLGSCLCSLMAAQRKLLEEKRIELLRQIGPFTLSLKEFWPSIRASLILPE